MSNVKSRYWRESLLALVALCAIGGTSLVAPIAQDPAYHAFVDTRAVAGLPNFWNVVSNIGFVLAGLYGAAISRRLTSPQSCPVFGVLHSSHLRGGRIVLLPLRAFDTCAAVGSLAYVGRVHGPLFIRHRRPVGLARRQCAFTRLVLEPAPYSTGRGPKATRGRPQAVRRGAVSSNDHDAAHAGVIPREQSQRFLTMGNLRGRCARQTGRTLRCADLFGYQFQRPRHQASAERARGALRRQGTVRPRAAAHALCMTKEVTGPAQLASSQK